MSASLRPVLLVLVLGCSQANPLPLMLDATVGDTNGFIACMPGLMSVCGCPGGARGIRVCQDDETYTPCLCVDARVPCFTGAVQGCACGDGVAGIQFCGEDGVFTGCNCPMSVMDGGEPSDALEGDDAATDAAVDVVDAPAQDVTPDRPDVCVCEEGTMRFCPLSPNQVEATYTNGRCRRGIQRCEGASCWGTCIGQVEPAPETCNGVDDNCNGLVDDIVVSCGLGPCRRVVNTCVDGGTIPCMPNFELRRAETCNGIDDDCNGMIDDMCRDF